MSENVLGLQAIFILYPYLVEGSFSVLDPVVEDGKATGDYNATFGLVLTDPTATCTYANSGGAASGYRPRRDEAVIQDQEFKKDTDCNVKNNHIARQSSKTKLNRSAASTGTGASESDAPVPTGKDSWKWILLGPAQQ
jgi:phospholipid/cholesterol/gamma-HCH transport system substrate-binding protein